MRTDELDFDLPPELIAQTPAPDRHASKLLHYRRSDRSVSHQTFSDLPGLLRPGDLLVFNDARVLPARFMLRKSTGGGGEGLFLEESRPGEGRGGVPKNRGGPPPPGEGVPPPPPPPPPPPRGGRPAAGPPGPPAP